MNRTSMIVLFILIGAAALGWVVYSSVPERITNTEYGYTFTIPSSLEKPDWYRGNEATLQFGLKGKGLSEESPMVSIGAQPVGESPKEVPADLSAWVREELKSFDDVVVASRKLDTVDAVQARYFGGATEGKITYQSVYAIHPNRQTMIRITAESKTDEPVLREAFEEVVGSFSFNK